MQKRTIYLSLILLLHTFWGSNALIATHTAQKENPIIEHLRDTHAWHFATIGTHHYTLHLPVILYKKNKGITLFSSRHLWDVHHQPVTYQGFRLNPYSHKIEALDQTTVYDFSITKDLANLFLSFLLLFLLFLSMAHYSRRQSLTTPPKGIWALLTYLVTFVRDHIAKENIGKAHYERFTPYLLTLFTFIWLNNTLGLLPGAGNVTGNISATLVLATFTFLITNFNGSRYYWHHIFNPPGVPKWLFPIIIPTEIISLFTKTITLMMRLFVNMLAGHLILISIISILFTLQNIFAAFIVVPIGTFMIFLKLGVSFLQAYIFTLLSAISIGNAVAIHPVTTTQSSLNLNPKPF